MSEFYEVLSVCSLPSLLSTHRNAWLKLGCPGEVHRVSAVCLRGRLVASTPAQLSRTNVASPMPSTLMPFGSPSRASP